MESSLLLWRYFSPRHIPCLPPALNSSVDCTAGATVWGRSSLASPRRCSASGRRRVRSSSSSRWTAVHQSCWPRPRDAWSRTNRALHALTSSAEPTRWTRTPSSHRAARPSCSASSGPRWRSPPTCRDRGTPRRLFWRRWQPLPSVRRSSKTSRRRGMRMWCTVQTRLMRTVNFQLEARPSCCVSSGPPWPSLASPDPRTPRRPSSPRYLHRVQKNVVHFVFEHNFTTTARFSYNFQQPLGLLAKYCTSVNQLLISLVPFIRDALLEFVNTGNLYKNVIITSLHKE